MLERLKVTHFRKRPPPPVTQHTAMPDALLHLIRGEPVKDLVNTRASMTAHERRGAQQPSAVETSVTKEMGTPVKARKRLTWVCPAPKRYSIQKDDDDEEVVGLMDDDAPSLPTLPDLSQGPPPLPPGQQQAVHQTSIGSLDSVELPSTSRINGHGNSTASAAAAAAEETDNSSQTSVPHSQPPSSERLEFDLQPKMKMISLSRIRPTIGMNLGKVDLCQAKCHVWDLGGRLADLWQRYYADCDAVVFVWKLGKDVVPRDEDEDEAERPEITYELQQNLLNQVRSSIGDEIPFLVLGHAFGSNQLCPVPTGPLYQTDQLLPHYHNPLQTFMVANAATGQGIQPAMEWLVPLAKRQLALREKSMEKVP